MTSEIFEGVETLRAAATSLDITPEYAIPLAGYRHRLDPFVGIADRLEANFLLLESKGYVIFLASFDLLYVGHELRHSIVEALAEMIPSHRVFCAASHTHCAPATDATKPALGLVDRPYVERLRRRVADAARALARAPRKRARLVYAETPASFAVNRRRRRLVSFKNGRLFWNKVVMGPSTGPRDDRIRMIRVEAEDSKVLSIIWQAACHPVAFPALRWVHPDYPGIVRATLRQRCGNVPVLFLQGYAGNLRPPTPSPRLDMRGIVRRAAVGREFGQFDEAAWVAWSDAFADAAAQALHSEGSVVSGRVTTGRAEVPLAALIAGAPSHRRFAAHILNIGDLAICGMSAEPVVEYLKLIGEATRMRVIPVGCLDDVFGYLPRASMLPQGGYEVSGYLEPFGLRGPVLPACEDVAVSAVVKASHQAIRDMEQMPRSASTSG